MSPTVQTFGWYIFLETSKHVTDRVLHVRNRRNFEFIHMVCISELFEQRDKDIHKDICFHNTSQRVQLWQELIRYTNHDKSWDTLFCQLSMLITTCFAKHLNIFFVCLFVWKSSWDIYPTLYLYFLWTCGLMILQINAMALNPLSFIRKCKFF